MRIALRRFLADTNAVVAALIKEHVFHKKARSLFEKVENICVTHLVIAEVSHVLHKLNVPANVFRAFITHLKTCFISSEEAVLLAADYLVSNNLSLSHFVDLSVIYTSLLSDIPLLSFDRKLIKRAKELGAEVIEV